MKIRWWWVSVDIISWPKAKGKKVGGYIDRKAEAGADAPPLLAYAGDLALRVRTRFTHYWYTPSHSLSLSILDILLSLSFAYTDFSLYTSARKFVEAIPRGEKRSSSLRVQTTWRPRLGYTRRDRESHRPEATKEEIIRKKEDAYTQLIRTSHSRVVESIRIKNRNKLSRDS